MLKINFVCLGNICRSPMAEFVLKDMVKKRGLEKEFYIVSSATCTEEIGNDIHRGTRNKLTEMQIPFTKRQAVQLTKADCENFDYILTMDKNNLRDIRRIAGGECENAHLLLEFTGENRDIADPWYTGNFDATYDDVVRGCEAFLTYLEENA